MRDKSWRTKWQEAYSSAEFYRSEKNTGAYWDTIAHADGGGLPGTEHICLLSDYMFGGKLLDRQSTLLDLGCGSGGYTVAFAEKCGYVTAMDFSAEMLNACRERCREHGLSNVVFVHGDITGHCIDRKYDCIMACLNPAAYQPDALDQMLLAAGKYVVYFSMDTPLENCENEPVYRGCNSVRFAEKYLSELGISYCKIPYICSYQTENGQVREIPFAYLIFSGRGDGAAQ